VGYICPYCGEGLPDDTLCPCNVGYDSYEEDDYDDEESKPRRRGPSLFPRQAGEEQFYFYYKPDVGQCPAQCLSHPEHIYILCYGRPVLVRDRDYLLDDPSRDYPITHYVGYTAQQPPVKRVREHGARSAHHIAAIRPGSMRDEEHAKSVEACPRCSQSLWYYAESPTYSDEYANSAVPGQGALLGVSARRSTQLGRLRIRGWHWVQRRPHRRGRQRS
jgi:hypothetical protein